ncbi:hypothetical protein F4604DRAFT_2002857 [Suillus subluteus]|nr:hypothetical protein F4604DRAFT_2002857 [Suillus subluteus]
MPNPPNIHTGNFSLNVSGVAGFFGGDEAISAIQTVHHYKARKFLGWYNSPGSWNVGKKFGKLAKSPFWDGLFPGANEEPAKLFDLDGKRGPKYVAARSGTVLEHTGHLAYLIMEKSKEELGVLVPGKRKITKLNKVTIIKMPGGHALAAILPIAASWITCAMCGWIRDWFCFSMILLGIISNGMFSLVIGLACLKLQGVGTAPTAPPGDGMLMDGDNIVLLLGREKEVATITRGRFILEYNNMVKWRSRKEKVKRSVPGDGTRLPESNRNGDAEEGQSNSDLEQGEEPVRDEYAAIGFFSFLLLAQLLAQLLLIPQGTFTGQIMFLISFAVSWLYNLYLSSIDNEYIQERSILEIFHLKKKHMRTYICRTRTTAAVFTCLMLRPPGIYEESGWTNLGFKPESIICNFIPNDTPVWTTWRKKVLDVMRACDHDGDPVACHNLLQMTNEEKRDFDANNRTLLETLLGDARAAYDLAMREQKWLTALP